MSPSKHAREAARARAERQAARRAAAARKRRNTRIAIVGSVVGVGALVAVIAVAAAGSKGTKDVSTIRQPQSTATPAASAAASAAVSAAPVTAPVAGTCSYPNSGTAAKSVGKPGPKPAGKKVTATLTTTVGGITFTMDGTKAPCTVNAFTYLASKGYFNNTKCHRLTTSGIYVLQCGDPTATGSGGPGFSFADENLTGLGTAANAQAVYPAGTVAMANSGPNTNGSQFFLVYKDSPLAASYTPFGTITGGLDVVQKVGTDGVAGGGSDGAPKDAVTIKTFVVS